MRAGACAIVAIAGAAVPSAIAFQEGGHYSLLLAVYTSGTGKLDAARTTEAFCTQLPDLAKEFDAITQRFEVLFDPREHQWGSLGKCSGAVSAHMVRTQFYLHALTGKDAAALQKGALQLRRNLVALAAAQPPGSLGKASLHCAVGFANHLMGDTRAHTLLAQKQQCDQLTLYETGQGHLFDGAAPDRLLTRPAKSCNRTLWNTWVGELAADIGGEADDKVAKAVVEPILHWISEQKLDDPDNGGRRDKRYEELLNRKLRDGLGNGAYKVMVEHLPPVDVKWNRTIGNACEDQVRAFFGKFPGAQPPSCQQAWNVYLDEARKVFPYHPDPTCRPVEGKQDSLEPDKDR